MAGTDIPMDVAIYLVSLRNLKKNGSAFPKEVLRGRGKFL
jgi:hypothetical protein